VKKRAKKLSLSRETLRHLERAQLGKVAGGSETREILTGCACTDTCVSDCGTCVGCGGGGGGGGTDGCTSNGIGTSCDC
jgi:hypothetical protein